MTLVSVEEHKQLAPRTAGCCVITVSDTRTAETDSSGRLMQQLLQDAGHLVYGCQIVKDDREEIRNAIVTGCQNPLVHVILLNGGTGIAKRDVTIEVVAGLFEKEMPGFGELFRSLSFSEIGTASMLSRAAAGVYQDRAIFALPGSLNAVRLGMTRLLLPEITHVVRELTKRA